jgi:hypothetical protein
MPDRRHLEILGYAYRFVISAQNSANSSTFCGGDV